MGSACVPSKFPPPPPDLPSYVGLVIDACVEVLELIEGQALPAVLALPDAATRASRLLLLETTAAGSPLGTLLPVLVTALTCFPTSTWLADAVLPRLAQLARATNRVVATLPSARALLDAVVRNRVEAQQRCVRLLRPRALWT
jgi:hypothetical protein